MIRALLFAFFILSLFEAEQSQKIEEILLYKLFELSVTNTTDYADSLLDVKLNLDITIPGSSVHHHYGFYDGNHTWRTRLLKNIFSNREFSLYTPIMK